MYDSDDELSQLRSAALQNAHSILVARQRAEADALEAKASLEKKAEELAHALATMRATLEATTDGILVTSHTGNVVDYNEKFMRFWHIQPDELASNRNLVLQQFMSSQCQDPDEFLKKEEDIYSTSPAESFDTIQLADGRICERYSRTQLVNENDVGRVWTFRDVTQQRRVEYALREESRVLEILNKSGTAIASRLDLESLVQQVTDAATEVSGAQFGAFFYNSTDENGEALSLYTLSGASRESFEGFGHPRATALFGPTFRGDPPIRSDDILLDPRYGKTPPHHGMPASHLPVRSYLAVPVISRSGEVIGGLIFGHPDPSVFTERTERIVVAIAAQAAIAIDNSRLYESAQADALERARLLDSERAARRVAEDQNRSKDAFIAMLGHELRNPLSAISAGISVIKLVGPSSDQALQAFEVIGRQSAHLGRLVDDLLDTARLLAGKIELKKQALDFSEAVESAMAAIRTTGKDESYTIDLSLEPIFITADPSRIEQIINNLISNSLKYTSPGGRISITLHEDLNDAVLTVTDTGDGMSDELLSRAFEPFEQGDRRPDRSQGGLGIGLTVIKQLVELHEGKVTLTSPGKGLGSTATVRIPKAFTAPSNAETNVDFHTPRTRTKILLIEDNEDARVMTALMLQLSDYEVIEAKNGTEGLALADSHCPEIGIVDIGLPDLTGYEVAKRLRVQNKTKKMRLIALTGYASGEDAQRALQSGFDVHLSKPLDFNQLAAAISLPN